MTSTALPFGPTRRFKAIAALPGKRFILTNGSKTCPKRLPRNSASPTPLTRSSTLRGPDTCQSPAPKPMTFWSGEPVSRQPKPPCSRTSSVILIVPRQLGMATVLVGWPEGTATISSPPPVPVARPKADIVHRQPGTVSALRAWRACSRQALTAASLAVKRSLDRLNGGSMNKHTTCPHSPQRSTPPMSNATPSARTPAPIFPCAVKTSPCAAGSEAKMPSGREEEPARGSRQSVAQEGRASLLSA